MADDKNKPLITPQSPSYERARQEQANPSPPGPAQVVGILNSLVELELEGGRACKAAAHASKDRTLALTRRLQIAEHEARGQALSEMVRAMGGAPPRLEEVRVSHSGEVEKAGADAGIVAALQKMETELRAAYDRAIADPNVSEMHRDALRRMLPSG